LALVGVFRAPAGPAAGALPPGCTARLPPGSADGGEPVFSLAYSPDGKALAAAGYEPTVRLWQPESGRELRRFRVPAGAVRSVAFAPDGKTLATAGADRTARLWEVAAGKELRVLRAHRFAVQYVAFAPDGKTVATGGGFSDPEVRLYDAATGKERLVLRTDSDDGGACGAFAPGGKTLACGTIRGLLRVWDAGSGKDLLSVRAHQKGVTGVQYLPDGATLVTAGGDGLVRLWDADRGEELRALKGHAGAVHALAVRPDGMLLATGGADRSVRLWEVATGREVLRLEGHEDDVKAVAFAPGGRALASGGADGFILLWDQRGAGRGKAEGPSKEELGRLWGDLAGADAPRAYRALWRLVDGGRDSVAFLRKRQAEVPRTSPEAARWVARLDSDRFDERQEATKRLRELGWQAEPALQKALEDRPSLEVRQRLERLHRALRKAEPSPDLLRGLRVIDVLERIGTREARELLRGLAGREPAGRLHREAKAALARLEGKR
jgi:hypothetical protein